MIPRLIIFLTRQESRNLKIDANLRFFTRDTPALARVVLIPLTPDMLGAAATLGTDKRYWKRKYEHKSLKPVALQFVAQDVLALSF
jgi:hypothetical protein